MHSLLLEERRLESLAVAVPVALSASKKATSNSSTSGSSSAFDSSGPTTGTTGSLIKMDDGSTFIYTNNFGWDWAEDPTSPFAMGGKAQSWSKRVGFEHGWLLTEPFVTPALYGKYVDASSIPIVDEWTLSIAMGASLATEMEEHYKTFILRVSPVAGLKWVRIPIGFWAIEAINEEPFLVGTPWTIQWACKYGIRIFMECASGKPERLESFREIGNHQLHDNGVMRIANAQRTLKHLRILTEFASQDQYRDVVYVIGIVNEILWSAIGQVGVQSFYYGAYETIWTATGVGARKAGIVGRLLGRIAFSSRTWPSSTITLDQMAVKPCSWAIATNQSSKAFGSMGLGPRELRSDRRLGFVQRDADRGFKQIGNSTVLGTSSSPLWHYQLGLERGWIPIDSREAIGHCAAVLNSSQIFDGTMPASGLRIQAGPTAIDPAQTPLHAFPPTTLSLSFAGT
ncbi:glycoside hydrolase superfamily [Mycena rosella]|uniref:glucan 1,3-beta-glucosidase n=1 Tax=Mycena rosella TaxID=1033263 RepID=A0AAD7DPL9_MYCRO|nr:glycoside hydrolase superfamily [Mycena rosella]